MKAYIYTRISHPDQKKGKGLEIQSKLAIEYCTKHNLTIDNTLVLKDEGQSAYHGYNISVGKLGLFLRAVQNGEVPIGSYLIFQNLDRLSRQDALTAMGVFNQIISSGINVVTLLPERTYTAQALKDNQYSIIEIVVTFIRAYEESYIKSKRHKQNWVEKRNDLRKTGKLLTHALPMWLKIENGKFNPIPERVRTIKMIFELAYKGHGKRYIANRLNEANQKHNQYPIWRSSKGIWQTSSIAKLLTNKELIGEFQPHYYTTKNLKRVRVPQGEPIKDYFPKVISEILFYSVQEKLASRPIITGNQKNITNLFTGIVTCGLCGSSMVYDDKAGKGNQSPNARYLICSRAKNRAGCQRNKLIYELWESKFLLEIIELNLDSLIQYQGNQRARKIEQVKTRISELNIRHKIIDKSINNLLELLDMDMPDIRNKLENLKAERTGIEVELEKQEAELKALTEQATRTYDSFKLIGDTVKLLDKVKGQSRYDLRLRLRNAIHDVVNAIWYFPLGTMELDLRTLFEFNGAESELPDDVKDIKGIKYPCCVVALNKSRYIDDDFHGYFIKIVLP